MVSPYRLGAFDFALPAGAHILPPEMVRAIEGANALLEAAEQKAAAIIADAGTVHTQERERGYREGWAAARLEAFERLIGESAALDAALRALEPELARTVLGCVAKLIDGFDDRAKAEAVVRSALKQMRREKRAELRVAPGQYAHFSETVASITAQFPELELVDVVEDAGLVAPRIIVETPIGRVDGNLGDNIADLTVALRRVVNPDPDKLDIRTVPAPQAAPAPPAAPGEGRSETGRAAP